MVYVKNLLVYLWSGAMGYNNALHGKEARNILIKFHVFSDSVLTIGILLVMDLKIRKTSVANGLSCTTKLACSIYSMTAVLN